MPAFGASFSRKQNGIACCGLDNNPEQSAIAAAMYKRHSLCGQGTKQEANGTEKHVRLELCRLLLPMYYCGGRQSTFSR